MRRRLIAKALDCASIRTEWQAAGTVVTSRPTWSPVRWPPMNDHSKMLIGSALFLALMRGLVGAQCAGDWNSDGVVTIDELLVAVRSSLSPSTDPADNWKTLGIGDLIEAVNNALTGCGDFESCRAGEPPARASDPEVRETVSGANGTFTDLCSVNGYLVEWVCEVAAHCVRDPINYRCTYFQSGVAVPRVFKCSGCREGTCRARCPNFFDTVIYLEISGEDALFENEYDQRRYQCVLYRDRLGHAGCLRTPMVGDREEVVSLGLYDSYCTDTNFGNVGLANGCSYQCGISPEAD